MLRTEMTIYPTTRTIPGWILMGGRSIGSRSRHPKAIEPAMMAFARNGSKISVSRMGMMITNIASPAAGNKTAMTAAATMVIVMSLVLPPADREQVDDRDAHPEGNLEARADVRPRLRWPPTRLRRRSGGHTDPFPGREGAHPPCVAARNSDSHCAAIGPIEKRSRTSTARRARLARRASSRSNPSIAAASASTLSGGTSRPSIPSLMMSRGPWSQSKATTARPRPSPRSAPSAGPRVGTRGRRGSPTGDRPPGFRYCREGRHARSGRGRREAVRAGRARRLRPRSPAGRSATRGRSGRRPRSTGRTPSPGASRPRPMMVGPPVDDRAIASRQWSRPVRRSVTAGGSG